MLVFLEYTFHFFISKALPSSYSVDQQNFMAKVLKMINLTAVCIISCRDAIDNVLTFHIGGPGFDSWQWKPFFFCFFFL